MIPSKAQPVVDVLRQDVPRPDTLPAYCGGVNFNDPWMLVWDDCCPMGLHPKSMAPLPISGKHFADGRCSSAEVIAFANWWDEQFNAQTAVDAIWPA